jgi:hypothetical protein
MLHEIIRVFYKVSEEDTGFADLNVMILLNGILVEILVENFAMLLPFVAVAHHTETPTPPHPVKRQRYTQKAIGIHVQVHNHGTVTSPGIF